MSGAPLAPSHRVAKRRIEATESVDGRNAPYERVPHRAPAVLAADEDFQTMLRKDGVVVIPTPHVDPDRRKLVVNEFLDHLRSSPEFKGFNTDDPQQKPVLGGFAALANPSSFHAPFLRTLREQVMAWLLTFDILPLEGGKLEQPFDRVVYRVKGQTTSAESMHRDEAPTALDGDSVYGGWLNLDSHPQFFSCAPGTHTDVGNANKGFAKIVDASERKRYTQRFKLIPVPPGHMVIFYERLVHEVFKKTAERLTLRVFFGWRVTDADEPLFGSVETDRWCEDQAVPKIKSGQTSVEFGPAHRFELRTFYHPDRRTVFKLPTPKQWMAHKAALSAVPVGGRVVRPRPEPVSRRSC
jgi:hypothetical protein